MGRPSTRVGDKTTGHESFAPVPAETGSGDVIVNGKAAHRQGDKCVSHASPSPSPAHQDSAIGGSGTVFINGKPAIRLGDKTDHNAVYIEGSSDVLIGD